MKSKNRSFLKKLFVFDKTCDTLNLRQLSLQMVNVNRLTVNRKRSHIMSECIAKNQQEHENISENVSEKQIRKTFGLKLSIETQEAFKDVLEKFKHENDPKGKEQEEALRRIIELAGSEAVRVMHPDLAPALSIIEQTLSTLVHQINGVVSAQDTRISSIAAKMEQTAAERDQALIQSKQIADRAAETEKIANEHVTKAFTARDEAEAKAQAEIATAKKEMIYKVEIATAERDRAIQERDDARSIATETKAQNAILTQQLTSLKDLGAQYTELQQKYAELEKTYNNTLSEIKETAIRQEYEVEKATMTLEKNIRAEYEKQIRTYEIEIAKLQAKLEE